MASYSLSGTGTHALTAGTTGLQVTITTPSTIGGSGRSNPAAKYDQGLIRFSDGTAYWSPVPILGGPQFIPVPANATSIGYALLGGAVISVVEVIGGTVFFSGGTPSIEQLTDVQVSSIADTQILAWNAAAGKWENVNQPTGGPAGAMVQLARSVLVASAASIDVSGISGSYNSLRLEVRGRSTAANVGTNVLLRFNNDSGAHYWWQRVWPGSLSDVAADSSMWIGEISGTSNPTNFAGIAIAEIPEYASATFFHDVYFRSQHGRSTASGADFPFFGGGWWNQTGAITQITVLPSAGSFDVGTSLTLWGIT